MDELRLGKVTKRGRRRAVKQRKETRGKKEIRSSSSKGMNPISSLQKGKKGALQRKRREKTPPLFHMGVLKRHIRTSILRRKEETDSDMFFRIAVAGKGLIMKGGGEGSYPIYLSQRRRRLPDYLLAWENFEGGEEIPV